MKLHGWQSLVMEDTSDGEKVIENGTNMVQKTNCFTGEKGLQKGTTRNGSKGMPNAIGDMLSISR